MLSSWLLSLRDHKVPSLRGAEFPMCRIWNVACLQCAEFARCCAEFGDVEFTSLQSAEFVSL